MNERRMNPRVRPLERRTEVLVGSHPARLIDLSLGGARLVIDRPLRPQSIQTMAVIVERGKVLLESKVQRCRLTRLCDSAADEDRPTYEVGVEFCDLDNEQLNRLRFKIERLSLGQSSPIRIDRGCSRR